MFNQAKEQCGEEEDVNAKEGEGVEVLIAQ